MAKITKFMITDFKKFKASWEKDAGTPENTIIYYLIAALNLKKNKKVGEAMMTIVISKKDCKEDGRSPSGLKMASRAQYFADHFLENPNSAQSYLGGTWENDYKYSKSKLTLTKVREVKHGKGLKIFIESGGRDNPVPCQLQKNSSGQWKLTEYSSFCMDVKPTKTEQGDF
ncbi:MAG: hypothetical protein P1Q69_03575 [Candidatus Thorarchaeota archaeon]|nr:hypothetical protein [Candidatus Thorarchaeota archaeon]